MPQIGWFEILIIVVVAILVIGPKDFPKVLNKDKKFPHEGIIIPNKTCEFHYKMYPDIYPKSA